MIAKREILHLRSAFVREVHSDVSSKEGPTPIRRKGSLVSLSVLLNASFGPKMRFSFKKIAHVSFLNSFLGWHIVFKAQGVEKEAGDLRSLDEIEERAWARPTTRPAHLPKICRARTGAGSEPALTTFNLSIMSKVKRAQQKAHQDPHRCFSPKPRLLISL